MKEKNKIILKAVGRFFLLWLGIGIIADILFALLGLSVLAKLSGLIGFIFGIWYARKKYIEEIGQIKKQEKVNQHTNETKN